MFPSFLLFLLVTNIILVNSDKERVGDGPVSPKGRDKGVHYEKLERNAGKENVQNFARNLDLNKDGFVDQEELQKWVVEAYLNSDNREAVERMSELDINVDGFVSWEEYMTDSFSEEELQNNKDDQKLLEQDKLYFSKADVNSDGKLDLEELAAFNTPENYPHMHSIIVESTLSEKDTNGDHAIDINEFLGEIADQKNSEWYEIEKNRFYNEYDANKDGKLTGDEVRHWLLPDANIVGSYEANHLLANSDDDKDGKLSYDEIVHHHSLFAKSDAAQDSEYHPYAHEEL